MLTIINITPADLTWLPQVLTFTYSGSPRIHTSKETHPVTGCPLVTFERLSAREWGVRFCGDLVTSTKSLTKAKAAAQVALSGLTDQLSEESREAKAEAAAATPEPTPEVIEDLTPEPTPEVTPEVIVELTTIEDAAAEVARLERSMRRLEGHGLRPLALERTREALDAARILLAGLGGSEVDVARGEVARLEEAIEGLGGRLPRRRATHEAALEAARERLASLEEPTPEPPASTPVLTWTPPTGLDARLDAMEAAEAVRRAEAALGIAEAVERVRVAEEELRALDGGPEVLAALLTSTEDPETPEWLLTAAEVARMVGEGERVTAQAHISSLTAPLTLLSPVPSVFESTLDGLPVLVDRFDGDVWLVSDASTHEDIARLDGGSWGGLSIWRSDVDPAAVREMVGRLELAQAHPGVGYHSVDLAGERVEVHVDGSCAYVWRLGAVGGRVQLIATLRIQGARIVLDEQYDHRLDPEAIREAVDVALLATT